MTRHKRDPNWPVGNSTYTSPELPLPEDAVETVRVPTPEEVAREQFQKAEQAIDAAMGGFLGNVFKAVCGVLGILIVISCGIAAIVAIWSAII
jgi:hypothetical protein